MAFFQNGSIPVQQIPHCSFCHSYSSFILGPFHSHRGKLGTKKGTWGSCTPMPLGSLFLTGKVGYGEYKKIIRFFAYPQLHPPDMAGRSARHRADACPGPCQKPVRHTFHAKAASKGILPLACGWDGGSACVRRALMIFMRDGCCAGAGSPAEISGRKNGRQCMKTLRWRCQPGLPRKHPHGCGEDPAQYKALVRVLETPPRVWGRLLLIVHLMRHDGNTPTGVGKTLEQDC